MDLGRDNRPFLEQDFALDESSCPLGTPEFVTHALAGAGIGTWQHDTLTNLISWDAVTSEIFGLDPLPGQGAGFDIHHADLPYVTERIEKCIHDGSLFDVECRAIRADGEVRWIHAKATSAPSAQAPKRYVAGILTDITDRKLVEEKVREAEKRYRLISQATMDFVYEWDFATSQLDWNQAFSDCFGHPHDQVQSLESLMEQIHPDDLQFVLTETRSLIKSGRSQNSLEYRIRRADGRYATVYACSHLIRYPSGEPHRLIGSLLDLTDRKLADVALQQSEALSRSIVEAVTECVMLISLDGKLELINGPGARAVGIDDPQALYGTDWASFWPHKARANVVNAVSEALRGGVGKFSEETPTMLGVYKSWDVVVSPVLADGKPTKLVAIARDCTEREAAQHALRKAATRDPLTDLMNRTAFQSLLSRSVGSASQSGKRIGLMVVDMDDFKEVNDSKGHDAGDALLVAAAERMCNVAPDRIEVARLGGDEFAILILNLNDDADAIALANKVLAEIRTPYMHNGIMVECSATVGVAVFPEHGRTPPELLKSADIALYVAKSEGRGRVTLFEAKHRADVQARQSMLSLGRNAIRNNYIVPFYQPKVAIEGHRIYGFEALLRWRDPRQGIQLPSTIAAAFEDLDLAAAISDRMIDSVIADMRMWLDQGLDFGHVAVNASAAEFRGDRFAESILTRLDAAGVPPCHFQIEVTETVFLGRGSEGVGRALNLLSGGGVSIALDDFGTGYASLRHLRQFPVDVIKIDQSFVRRMDVDPDDAAIISAVLNLGRSLNIAVVAEGIETEEQEQQLQAAGCRYGQGFLYSPAMPAQSVAPFVQHGVQAYGPASAAVDARRRALCPAAGGGAERVPRPSDGPIRAQGVCSSCRRDHDPRRPYRA